jgi:hypothetical protein
MTIIKYRELHIDLAKGVKLIIDVTSKAEVEAALADLRNFAVERVRAQNDISTPAAEEDLLQKDGDSPESRIETRSDLPSGFLRKKGILAFKDGIPQLLRPPIFGAVSDAALILLFAIEAGLKKTSVSFEDFKALYDAQNIKSGSPLSMLLTNLKNAGYIDKSQYSSNRTVRLTAKGEKKATDVLAQVIK